MAMTIALVTLQIPSYFVSLAREIPAIAAAAPPGYGASFAGESTYLTFARAAVGTTAQFAVIFTNTGTTTWLKGSGTQVNLAVCLPTGVTCNVASPNAAWNDSTWLSSTAYATTSEASVAPGSFATFAWNVKVPATTTENEFFFYFAPVLATTGELLEGEVFRDWVRLTDGTVYTVTSTADSGSGTLRQAILDANANAGRDTIFFSFDGTASIALSSPLPPITDSVFLDATTPSSFLSHPSVELNGASAGATAVGLHLSSASGGSTIRGLAINGFAQWGIQATAGGGSLIAGNFVGTDITGATAKANGTTGDGGTGGIQVLTPSYRIGTGVFEDRNVVSGNLGQGIEVGSFDAPFTVVDENIIGRDSFGDATLPNGFNGIVVLSPSATVQHNLVSGNTGAGMSIASSNGSYRDNTIQYNSAPGILLSGSGNQFIGNDISANTGGGVFLGAPNATTEDNFFSDNIVRSNTGRGFELRGPIGQTNEITDRNSIHTGSISGNTLEGILLAFGANGGIAPPTITTVSTGDGLSIAGSAAPNSLVDIYVDPAGQGLTAIGGATADGNGAWQKSSSWAVTDISPIITALRAGTLNVTTTQTDTVGNTSQFSPPFTLDTRPPAQPLPPTVSGLNSPTGQTWTGYAEAGSTVKLKIHCTTSPTVIGTAPADATTGFYTMVTTPPNPPGDGSYPDVCVTATDAAGNESLPSAGDPISGSGGKSTGGGTVTTDVTPPAAAISAAQAATSSQPINFVVTFTNGPSTTPEFVSGFDTNGIPFIGTNTGYGIRTNVPCGTLLPLVTPLDPTTSAPLAPYEPSTKFNIQVSGMTTSCQVTVSVPPGKAHDAAGNLNTASGSVTTTFNFVRDTTPPVVTITGTPINNSTGNVTFGFSSTKPGSTFQCQLNGPTPVLSAPCSSPKQYTGLSGGSYTFSVLATDVSNNPSTPATFSWTVTVDGDRDGLLDTWETAQFVDVVVGSSTVRVDLPDADPARQDIYMQIDWMQDPAPSCHVQKPTYDAIKLIYDAFIAPPHGIKLHVDLGPDSPRDYSIYSVGMNYATYPATSKWGALSHAGSVAYASMLGSFDGAGRYQWSRPTGTTGGTYFDDLKNRTGGFGPSAREAFYHYVLWGHQWDSTQSSGLSRSSGGSGGGDFMVTLGGFPPFACTTDGQGTLKDQAGTFMHELGHNLGLAHGGDEPTNRKPNYVSVMNYAFQNTGLTEVVNGTLTTGIFDYSDATRAGLAALDERVGLTESSGLGPSGASYGTSWTCPFGGTFSVTSSNGAIDWNCNGNPDTTALISGVNINADNKLNADAPCIGPGLNGKLDTVPQGDDYVYGQTIRAGDNRKCDTTLLAGDDASLPATGGTATPFEQKLRGYDDWSNLKIKVARIGQPGFFSGAPPQTPAEDRDLRTDTLKNVVAVSIDIVPGDSTNTVSGSTVDVAVLSSTTFDPTTLLLDSVQFGPAGAKKTGSPAIRDVNGDGRSDLVFTFNVAATGLTGGSTQACLTAATATKLVSGCDQVITTSLNHAPTASAGGPYSGSAGAAVSFTGAGSDTDTGDTVTFAWAFGDGASSQAAGTGGASHTYAKNGCYAASLTVTDTHGASATSTAAVSIGAVTPNVGPISAGRDPVAIGQAISVSGTITDACAKSHVATWGWGDGTSSAGTITGGNDNGTVSGNHAYAAAGVYMLTLTVADSTNAQSQGRAQFEYVVIYDPTMGFAGGSGWIDSPGGACQLTAGCKTATGPAYFGFVMKNPRGALGSGATNFDFRFGTGGSLNLQSTSFNSLVLSGDKAQITGTATINGTGSYVYVLTAVDGSLSTPAGPDRLRMRIVDSKTGAVVYDNAPGDNTIKNTRTQAISGGSIVIQK